MNNSILEIKNYILFLKKDCNLEITLHPYENEHLISNSELISFNIHENPYCIYVKTFAEAQEHCVARQKKVLHKSASGSFCGSCYAGVKEFIYPIYDNTSLVGFISISGYREQNYESYINKCSNKFNISQKNLEKTILSLKSKIPNKSYVDTLIIPLIRMLELAYIKLGNISNDSSTIEEIKKYVNRHYAEDITIEQLCKIFSCSRSYICHTFKVKTGHTFHEHLTAIRLRSAKSLLLHSNLSVSEIAYSVGFNDSNYFSSTFKSHVGLSPMAYRKKQMIVSQ
ncbi:MAG: AraC family transcriptional regulator [Oscillospiraceae bacterium]|nr:AraC family transcriptional regulator [Oscillospiraceae bacterium]